MAAHVCLKNVFTEDEKYHNLMSWLINSLLQLLKVYTELLLVNSDNQARLNHCCSPMQQVPFAMMWNR